MDTTKPYGWNGSFKDIKTNIQTDYTAILNQASVFNIAGRVFAPRYRQAHIKSYSPVGHADTLKAIAAFELAYQDIKSAFDYYMKNENNGRPIIIASHSQGSTHAMRLLKEYFDDKPLAKKLIAAYVVGMAINPADYVQLKPCATPTSLGCICAWRTYKEGYTPSLKDPEEEFVFGKGWSYGAEFYVNKARGNFTGWIGYTLSWTQLQFDELNFGKKYYARYDRRHDISVVGIYKAGDRWTFSSTFVYSTGNAVTFPIAKYNLDGIEFQQNIVLSQKDKDFMKFCYPYHKN